MRLLRGGGVFSALQKVIVLDHDRGRHARIILFIIPDPPSHHPK